MPSPMHDPERLIDLDLIRCTENAALAARKWLGKGDKNRADAAAADAIRGMFSLMNCRGIVRIGEGRKDEAPGIFTDEKLGSWAEGTLPVAIALDPIDGTTPLSRGLPGSISVLAAATSVDLDGDPRHLFPDIRSYYMQKLAVGPKVVQSGGTLDLDTPLSESLPKIAESLQKRVEDLVAVVLDRPRHETIITTLRKAGCAVRMIRDGDVAAAIAPCLPNSGVDLYVGIGGSPEAVLAGAAIKCLGGQMLSRMHPRDDEECQRLLNKDGVTKADLAKVWTVEELAQGDHIVFAATGISDSPMLRGIRFENQYCVTESLQLRARHRTLRRFETYHDMNEKTIRVASSDREVRL